MKKRKKTISLLALLMLVILSSQAAFAASDITREYEFVSETSDFNYTEHTEIEESGKKYIAKDIEYEVIKNLSQIEKTYENLPEKKVPDDITDSDVKFILKSVNYEEKTVTGIKKYENYISMPNIPITDTVTYEGNNFTGKRVNVSSALSKEYNTPFSVKGTFYGDSDSLFYMIGEKKIPASSAPGFETYSLDLLNYLNLDGNIYRIDNASWDGEHYQGADGVTARDAVYTGMQKSNIYTATYEAASYTAKAVYENEDEKNSKYLVKATVTYEEVKDRLGIKEIIIYSAGAIILALLIGAILFILSKRKKKERA